MKLKDALVAEIERMMAEEMAIFEESLMDSSHEVSAAPVVYTRLQMLLSAVNTLEVKEVDLEKETTHYLLYEHRSPLNEIMHKADLKSEMQYHKDIENAFKAGFKLGMAASNKAQKGEEV